MIPAVLLGGLATTYINIDLGFGAVIGSAAVGLAGAYVPADFPEKGVENGHLLRQLYRDVTGFDRLSLRFYQLCLCSQWNRFYVFRANPERFWR